MIALGIVVATAAAFLVSAVYYGIAPAALPAEPVPQRAMGALALVELLRNLAVAALIAGLLAAGNWSDLVTGLLVGSSLSILPAVLLAGSVFHEGVPPRRAGVHAMDWLIKLVAMGSILGPFS
jgi:hypothetical protein